VHNGLLRSRIPSLGGEEDYDNEQVAMKNTPPMTEPAMLVFACPKTMRALDNKVTHHFIHESALRTMHYSKKIVINITKKVKICRKVCNMYCCI
jgi:hypothetical protein